MFTHSTDRKLLSRAAAPRNLAHLLGRLLKALGCSGSSSRRAAESSRASEHKGGCAVCSDAHFEIGIAASGQEYL